VVHLDPLPSGRDRIEVAEVVKDALRRDPDALALEGGVGVAGRLWGSLTDLRSGAGEARQETKWERIATDKTKKKEREREAAFEAREQSTRGQQRG